MSRRAPPVTFGIGPLSLVAACGEGGSDSGSDQGGASGSAGAPPRAATAASSAPITSYVEENKAEWFDAVGGYCPWSATVTRVARR